MKYSALFFILVTTTTTWAQHKYKPKGVLPEFSKEENVQASEQLISNIENKAIDSLNKILKKKRGTPDEPGLLLRLGEIYTKKARTSRFLKGTGKVEIAKAIDIYANIRKRFPKYENLDQALFSQAFLYNNIGQINAAKSNYIELIGRFPNSVYIGDSLMALGDLFYEEGKFKEAIKYYSQVESSSNVRLSIYAKYKSAWAEYNLKNNDVAVAKLIQVAEQKSNHSLRKEALNDLGIFVSETKKASELYHFFKKIADNKEELGEAIINLAKLYESHSRYQELVEFTQDFIDDDPLHPSKISLEVKIIESLESIKKRKELLGHIKNIAIDCSDKSDWQKANTKEVIETQCKEYKSISAELTKKWWDIWLKNKKHEEFSKLTKDIFQIITDFDSKEKPDIKLHLAFAELLYQQNYFQEAGERYYYVSTKSLVAEKPDLTIAHDSSYSAIYSLEQVEEKKRTNSQNELRTKYVLHYIDKFKDGKYFDSIQLKYALILYSDKKYEDSAKILKKLAEIKDHDIKEKAQDLLLDIYNIQKDYANLIKYTKDFSKNLKNEARLKNLNQIQNQSEYNYTQLKITDQKADKQVSELENYLESTKDATLKKKVHQQLIGILFANKLEDKSIKHGENYIKQFPDEDYSLNIRKELITIFNHKNLKTKAAEQLLIVADREKKTEQKIEFLLAASELYKAENKSNESRSILRNVIKLDKPNNRPYHYKNLYYSYTDKNNPEFIKLRGEISKLGYEPMASEIMVENAEDLMKSNKVSDAFSISMKIIGRDIDKNLKARARLIQAQVLESEFIKQSTKSKLAKLSIVLSLKTDKLDKAQTAYISTINMASDYKIQLKAYSGLRNCYSDYINSLNNIQITDQISNTEMQELKSQLNQLVKPIEDKLKDVNLKLAEFEKVVDT